MSTAPEKTIAIVGFGFSGLMVLANLVRRATGAMTIYVVAEHLDGRGIAYGTAEPHHLLNVTAERMGAFADAPRGFLDWLQSRDGKIAEAALKLPADWSERDFAPRMLYGAYLDGIWQQAQREAAEKSIRLQLVSARATALVGEPMAVRTDRGDAIAVDAAVLCVGHEFKPLYPELPGDRVLREPWSPHAFADAPSWGAPVVLVGSGLTAIDMLLSLRAHGYRGEVVAASRHGRLPQVHRYGVKPFEWDKTFVASKPTLQKLLHYFRAAISSHGDWRGVVEGVRPHTVALWQQWSLRDQQRFLRRLVGIWNVFRHRMAPSIGLRVQTEIEAGTFRVVAARRIEPTMEEGVLRMRIGEETLAPSKIIACTGPEMAVARSARPVLKQALAEGLIEPHPTGWGIASDPHGRAWGQAYPRLYAVGSLLTGQRLESTAVPELRAQAATVAEALCLS